MAGMISNRGNHERTPSTCTFFLGMEFDCNRAWVCMVHKSQYGRRGMDLSQIEINLVDYNIVVELLDQGAEPWQRILAKGYRETENARNAPRTSQRNAYHIIIAAVTTNGYWWCNGRGYSPD